MRDSSAPQFPRPPLRACRTFGARRTLGLVALLSVSAALPAAAQRVTGGVLQPDGDVAAGVDAQMVEVNPAGLGFGTTFDSAMTYTQGKNHNAGDGFGFYLGLGVLDPYHTALGIQVLDAAPGFTDRPVKVSWGHALRLGEVFSIGATWHTFVSDEISALDGLSTWDLGVQMRPWRWLATGLNITDLTTPKYDGGVIDRGYEVAVAVHPGTERVTLTGLARFEDRAGAEPTFGGLLRARLFGPIGLLGRYDTTELGGVRDHRVMLGLADLGGFGLGLFGYTHNRGDADTASGLAITSRIRSQSEPLPSLFRRPVVAEVTLGKGAEYSSGGWFSRTPRTPFLDTLQTLRALARNDEVSAVLLGMGSAEFGWAQAAELRAAIGEVRAAGKKVYAWLPVGQLKAYSVAVAADQVYGAPAGGLLITGLEVGAVYVGELLAKLGIKADFVAIGDYKSAPEMFTRTGPTPASMQQTNALLDEVYGRAVEHIAERRKLTEDQVRSLIDGAPYTSQGAVQAGLMDGVVHYDEFEGVLRRDLGPRVTFRPAEELLADADPRWGRLPAVAVLYAVGTITDGDSVSNPFSGAVSTGADTFVRAVRALREDSSVRAVVLRVDSPGGSVTAADAMWRELSELARRKPLYVSMGDTAASGGYYIAAPGREILAQAETLTGSIGIFTGKFDVSGLFGMIGLHKTSYKRGADADLLSEQAPFSDGQREKVRVGLQALYELFLDRVAAGRPTLGRKGVEPLAGGRVWSGRGAHACGLVDREAGLLTAIDLAAQAADLGPDDYRLIRLPDAGGLGGLPASPFGARAGEVGVFEGLRASVAESVAPAGTSGGDLVTALGQIPGAGEALRAVLDAPILRFGEGQALALLPFVWSH